MIFTDTLIETLLTCPKKVTNPPKEAGASRGSSKIRFLMESTDGEHSFTGFISQNICFQENFSIGLVYYPKDEKGSIVLMRVNGPHGPNENIPHHEGPHVHLATAERINAGLRPEGLIDSAVPYITKEEAVQYYIKRINLIPADRIKYFPPPDNQIAFNFDNSDSES